MKYGPGREPTEASTGRTGWNGDVNSASRCVILQALLSPKTSHSHTHTLTHNPLYLNNTNTHTHTLHLPSLSLSLPSVTRSLLPFTLINPPPLSFPLGLAQMHARAPEYSHFLPKEHFKLCIHTHTQHKNTFTHTRL